MLLLLLSLLAASVYSAHSESIVNVHVPYVDLALQRCDRTSKWSIHGWWPEYNQTSYPQFCNKSKCQQFDIAQLQPIRSQLNMYWLSCQHTDELTDGLNWNTMILPLSNDQFWKHEWCKHGTCFDDMQELDYFNHTLAAFKEAQSANMYDCCDKVSRWNECLIPFSTDLKHTKWLGYCH